MMRIYWCCTHVTLRKTEIPIFLDLNVEVVPEEVNVSALNRLEGESYENESIHQVIRQWREKCTLNDNVLNILRRARLSERKGNISSIEKIFFNNYFDAIYVATDLDTAVEINSWFDGDVIFRYFGFFDNLKNLNRLLENYDKDKVDSIIFCPIFTSLLEIQGVDFFQRSAVVHGYIDQSYINFKWSGWQDSQNAVVMGHLFFSDTYQNLSKLIPLSEKIEIDLMGKYDPNALPYDIAEAYNLIGQLPYDTYLKHFLSARVLIHPFGNPYHNHFTNIEACVGGMPILFLKDNPLYNENILNGLICDNPKIYGAFDDIDELITNATYLFADRPVLETIAKHQQFLLTPFSRNNVRREIGLLLDLISYRRTEKLIEPKPTVFSGLPCADLYYQRNTFVNGADNVPISAFLYYYHLPNLSLNKFGEVVLILMAKDGCTQLFLTDGKSRLSEGYFHKITIHGTSQGSGTIIFAYEMWNSVGIIDSGKYDVLCSSADESINFSFDVVASEPVSFVLYITVTDSAVVELNSISHKRRQCDC